MGLAYFYQLSGASLKDTLAMLITKARENGWRVLVRTGAQDRLEWLDKNLWLGRDADFLPHGIAGGEFDADQPVLLTTGDENPNASSCLMAIDAAPVSAREVNTMQRVCIIFDGGDDAHLRAARQQWQELSGAGCGAQYWAQDGAKWVKKQTKAAAITD
ncbi:MAG: DNA polymerase III subunit chi [Paracoccaceae bacterium]